MKKKGRKDRHERRNEFEDEFNSEFQSEDDFEYPLPNDGGYEEEFESDDEQKISAYYTQRRLQKNRMERKVRQSQMWLKRLQFLLRMVTIALLIFFGYSLLRLPQWYLNKNVFSSLNSPSLEISNNRIVPSYKILAALRRSEVPHTPIYKLETDEIKRNIMQLDPIENVYIRRFWFPARLQIIVEERVPLIIIAPDANVPPVAFLAKGGKLIGRDYLPLPKSFKPILVFSHGAKGDDYRHWDNEKIKLIENIAKTVSENSNEEVEYIDLRNPKDAYVKVKTANIRLGDIEDSVFERISRISSILPQIKILDKKIKYVDLRWKNANYIKLGE